MIQKKYLKFLCCPACNGDFQQNDKGLQCSLCNRQYIVSYGIPRLLKGGEGIDVQISTEKWDNVYGKNIVREYKIDNMLLSQKNFLSRYKRYIGRGIFLDLGCGIAWQSLFLAEEGISTIGVDISLIALMKSTDLFKKEKVSGCFLQADFLHLPLRNNSIQFIYWGLSIEYVRDTRKAVREAYRVLKPGGRIVVPFPVASLTTILYHQLRGGDIPRLPVVREIMELIHVKILKGRYMHYGYGQTFTVAEIGSVFKKTGFHVQKIDYYDMYYPLTLVPPLLRPILRYFLHFRPFWPFAFIEAIKK